MQAVAITNTQNSFQNILTSVVSPLLVAPGMGTHSTENLEMMDIRLIVF